ncbi:MAG TPA: aminoglycoside adenylyltransferase domain-containing protein [Chloroflexia bacterium]|nr:aminoglycoside adenylyltransferase domain-containing protein [Chloroflexia bacterium]
MPFTDYPEVNELLDGLLHQIQLILGTKLVGLYLYGSLVTDDFDRGISDVDLLAAISSDIDEDEFAQLQKMHHDIVDRNKEWDNRIEIAYLSVDALQTYNLRVSKLAIISPGEPFHVIEAGKDWLMNWYVVREKGIALFGPSPKTIIAPVTKEEFIQAVTDHAKSWKDWIEHIHSRPSQSYAILTMCRALYAYKNGEQVSKRQAALWAEKELPEWASLIRNALLWREGWREKGVDHEATFPETVRFVHFVVNQIFEK